jgi:hypothetical protein
MICWYVFWTVFPVGLGIIITIYTIDSIRIDLKHKKARKEFKFVPPKFTRRPQITVEYDK